MSFETSRMEDIMENPEKMKESLEEIAIAAVKLKEKYGEYMDMKLFIDYLAGVERIFVLAKMEKWGAGRVKKAFIECETYLMSMDSVIEEDIFNRIKDDFQSAYQTLDLIRSVADKLMAEHAQCVSCVNFIEYMRDSLILLSDISSVNIDYEEDRILRARMILIGGSNAGELEKVYNEFKSMIGKGNMAA